MSESNDTTPRREYVTIRQMHHNPDAYYLVVFMNRLVPVIASREIADTSVFELALLFNGAIVADVEYNAPDIAARVDEETYWLVWSHQDIQ